MSTEPVADGNEWAEVLESQTAERSRSPDTSFQVDTAAVAALRRGDERAFLAVFNSLHPMMVTIARGYVGSHDQAEEVAQETWVAVVRGLAGYRGACALSTWIVSILIRKAKSHTARQQRESRSSRATDCSSWASGGNALPTPEDICLGDEERELIWSAIRELPERLRLVLTLRDIHGLDAESVSETLGVSAANLRVLLHRARKRLGVLLREPPGRSR
jgi:RNA polymerase sigma-70 factor (ECF subfamily)